MSLRCLLICIDGADFRWIDRMGGKALPQFHSLMDRGASAYLNSVFPPMSCPAWVSMRTGLNPGRLGFVHFAGKAHESYTVEPVNYNVAAPALWDLLSDAGRRIGVVNVHLTSPPSPLNGVVVAPIYGRWEDCCHPPELRSEIEGQLGKPHCEIRDKEAFLEEPVRANRRIEENRFELARFVYERGPYDFFACGFSLDRVNHYMPDPLQARACYRHMDRILGRLLELTRPRNVLIVSDHGGGALRGAFHTNEWLAREGFLKRRRHSLRRRILTGAVGTLKRIGRAAGLRKLLEPVGVLGAAGRAARGLLPDWQQHVDWENTAAYSPFGCMIYVNLAGREPAGAVPPARRQAVAESVRDALNGLPDTWAYLREEIYTGRLVEQLPDVVFWRDDYQPQSSFPGRVHLPLDGRSRRGTHRRKGIFIAAGEEVKAAEGRGEFDLLDVCPTLLHLMGQPPPRPCDGRILPIWRAGSSLTGGSSQSGQRSRVGKRPAPSDGQMLVSRLRALGYLE